MKITRHAPPPVPTPPVTYDLIGLTEAELRTIGVLVGKTSRDEVEAKQRDCVTSCLRNGPMAPTGEMYSSIARALST